MSTAEPSRSGADLSKYVIGSNQSIYDAMVAINDNWREVVLVDDCQKRIVGLVTDGDIRRGLLRGLRFDAPVVEIMSRDFVSVSPQRDRASVLDIMKSLYVRQVPVLNSRKRLVGIHFLTDLIGNGIKPNAAVIMAGGKGTRLRPLTESCPKPMVKVAGRPILERIVLHLVGYGIRKIFLSINYLGEMIETHFGDGSRFGCSIAYLREQKAMGTGGALSLLPAGLTDPIIVMNGDQITQVNIARLLEFHATQKVSATIGVRHHYVEIPFGVVRNQGNLLQELQEKPTVDYLVNAGIYVIDPSLIRLVPRNEEFPITALFDRLLKAERRVGIHHIDEEWIDVGRPDDLKKANGFS
jgi:dTDP-glucose pyrophosphorylase/CBS domain-containing protein